MAKGLKRRTIGIITVALAVLSVVTYCMSRYEFTYMTHVALTDIFEGLEDGTFVTDELTDECDQLMTRFRFNPALYARVYDYSGESGVAPLVYQFGEKQPKKNVSDWETRNKRWRVITASAFGAGIWKEIRNVSLFFLAAAIIFLIWFIDFPQFEKFRKRSG